MLRRRQLSKHGYIQSNIERENPKCRNLFQCQHDDNHGIPTVFEQEQPQPLIIVIDDFFASHITNALEFHVTFTSIVCLEKKACLPMNIRCSFDFLFGYFSLALYRALVQYTSDTHRFIKFFLRLVFFRPTRSGNIPCVHPNKSFAL